MPIVSSATRTLARASRSALCLLAFATLPALADDAPSRVRVNTNQGSFVIQLESTRAPLSSANFLTYVKSGYYVGTIFHRVISNFVIQAGGYDEKQQVKVTQASIPNESGNGLSNKRGTVGLARSEAPHSGNAQFYVNVTDNDDLDPTPLRWGYAVFGRVVEGMDIVDKISHVPTGSAGPWSRDAPLDAVVITGVELQSGAAAAAAH